MNEVVALRRVIAPVVHVVVVVRVGIHGCRDLYLEGSGRHGRTARLGDRNVGGQGQRVQISYLAVVQEQGYDGLAVVVVIGLVVVV